MLKKISVEQNKTMVSRITVFYSIPSGQTEKQNTLNSSEELSHKTIFHATYNPTGTGALQDKLKNIIVLNMQLTVPCKAVSSR